MVTVFALAAASLAWQAEGAANRVVTEWVEYPSTIDGIANLRALLVYPREAQGPLPLLVVMHGFREAVNSFPLETYARMASAYGDGVFVLAVEMRGRGGSGGVPDAGGREVQDIADAVRFVLRSRGQSVDATQIHIVGYSGGGGNALACAARFPDLFASVTSFFGISDYGMWFGEANEVRREVLRKWAGGSPEEKPAAYASRAAANALGNYSGGLLRLFHDRLDDAVPATQSERAAAAMGAAGLTNFALRVSEPNDSVRWLHGGPNGSSPNIQAEPIWLAPVAWKALGEWTVPAAGRLRVAGYLATKRFELWLGDGTSHTGEVVYDATRREFQISATPLPARWKLVLPGCGKAAKARVNGRAVRLRGCAVEGELKSQ